MMDAQSLRSGKTHRDENFPVARFIQPRHREAILSFYEFVRVADDIADQDGLPPEEKLAILDRLEASLLGRDDGEQPGVRLRRALRERSLSDQHALDLLKAFRQDVTKLRYETWDELIDYCALSAMPVGRFVLDVHGESRETWRASDSLCAALQIINHLQDCGQDYQRLNRVYLPREAMERAGTSVEELSRSQASPALRACLGDLARRTRTLVEQGSGLPSQVVDFRLAMECEIIAALAFRLTDMLEARDPLCEKVHLGKPETVRVALAAVARGAWGRLIKPNRRTAQVGGQS